MNGKGMFTWKLLYTEGGDPVAIRDKAIESGFSWLQVKLADRGYRYNVSVNLPAIVDTLKNAGINVCGWAYTYGGIWFDKDGNYHVGGASPEHEAEVFGQYANELGISSLIVDAEREYKVYNQASRATRYMNKLREIVGQDKKIYVSSYRYPSYHPEFPWSQFRSLANGDLPQVYWEKAHNSAYQLQKSFNEFTSLSPRLDYIPAGAAYYTKSSGQMIWYATPEDVIAFMNKAKELELNGCTFWGWWHCRYNLPQTWDAIANYQWTIDPPDLTLEERVARLEEVARQHGWNV